MSGIFGIVHRDGSPCDVSRLEALGAGMADCGRSGCHIWHDGPAGLGQARSELVAEDRFDRVPVPDEPGGVVFTASGRIDNREELAVALDASASGLSALADSDVLLRCYARWGEDACERIYGDWSFAAWHPREQRLVVARDHFGNTSLYYHATPRLFVFASSPTTILRLGLVPSHLDELYLGQVLVGWLAFHGARTIYRELNRLPPAHVLRVDRARLSTRRYWHPERAPVQRFSRREDYVSAFRQVFDEAVRVRLRGTSTPAVTLSGGLDTGSITAVAARLLAAANRRLPAFTWVPMCDAERFVAPYFGDELPYAEATAAAAGNVDLETIDARDLSPIIAIRRGLALFAEPGRGPANFPWLFRLMERTAARGSGAVLIGQFGNYSVSWYGNPFSQPLPKQLRLLGPTAWARLRLEWLKARLAEGFPKSWIAAWRRRVPLERWCLQYAVRPEFARRLDLQRGLLGESLPSPLVDPRAHRIELLMLGRCMINATWAQWGSVSGIEVRDPTADPRVIRFVLSIPDEVFTDPIAKTDRWLIREAMRGLLPDSVRLNRNVGRQAADYVVRLRNCAAEVDEALEQISSGPAVEYLDLPLLRRIWAEVRTQDSHPTWIKAVTTLPRSLMAGLFLSVGPRAGCH